jgi:hypothetical protein
MVITVRRLSALAQVAVAAVLVAILARPLVFGGSDRGVDFYTHYWYMWHQSEALRQGGPSLYFHDVSAVFVPLYAFYGGTLYVSTGALALLLGSPYTAYVLSFLLGFAASYGGWWWLARQAGIRGFAAHAPGVVFVTSAYAISLLYVRGDWPEHMAVSMLPLLAASGLSVLRADRARLLPVTALAISSMLFFGSHNLTLLCGVTVLAALIVLLLLAVPEARALANRRALLRIVAVVVPALLVDAWFLLPDLMYQSETTIAGLRDQWRDYLETYGHYVSAGNLLTLGRGTVEPVAPRFSLALPVLAVAWTVVAVAAARPRLRDPWTRTLLVLGAVALVLLFVMTHVETLRGPFVMLQFSYRLESYVNLLISGMVLVGLVLLDGRPSHIGAAIRWSLAPVAAVSIALAVWQSDVHRDPSTYTEWHKAPGFYTARSSPNFWNFSQTGVPVGADDGTLPRVAFRPQAVEDGQVSAVVRSSPGGYVLTNVAGVWPLLRLRGASFAGMDGTGRAVVQLAPDAPAVSTLTVEAAKPPAVVIGRWLSFLGLAGLAANFVVIGVRARRRRQRRRGGPTGGAEVPAREAVVA